MPPPCRRPRDTVPCPCRAWGETEHHRRWWRRSRSDSGQVERSCGLRARFFNRPPSPAHPAEPRARRGRCRSARLFTAIPRLGRTTPGGVIMRFVGLDLHKRTLEVCILDAAGKVLARHSVACERKALEAFARDHLDPADRLAVEATTSTWAVAAILRPFVATIVASNPMQTRA